MKVGLSTYSLVREISAGKMTVIDAIEWIHENGGEHVEIVPIGFDLIENPELIDEIKNKTKELGMEISNYAISSDVIKYDENEFRDEVERIKTHVDIANKLGVKLMRHDVASFSRKTEENTIFNFENDLHLIVKACKEIADYAAKYGITTSIENHGFYVNGSDRVQRVLKCVDKVNFKTTLDIGNFLCVDETPEVGVKKNLPYASMVHFKDFYIRRNSITLGDGDWFISNHGTHLKGAIVGHGDIDILTILKMVKNSGYDGYISLEFEGMEDCKLGSKIGMDNIKRLWNLV